MQLNIMRKCISPSASWNILNEEIYFDKDGKINDRLGKTNKVSFPKDWLEQKASGGTQSTFISSLAFPIDVH